MSGSCLQRGREDLEHMKRLQMINLTLAGFKRSLANQQRHMEYHRFKNSWHLLHNGPYLNVKYDTLNRQHFLHNGVIFEYVNKIWWKRLLNNSLPWVPYHYDTGAQLNVEWMEWKSYFQSAAVRSKLESLWSRLAERRVWMVYFLSLCQQTAGF